MHYHRLSEWNTEIPIDDSILGNEDRARLDAELDPTHKTFELYQYLKNYRHFAVKVIDRKIASFCFDNSNGTLSVETVPDFRNQGLSKKCLAKVTKAICDSKSYPKIHFPTDIENVAARKVAESAGFKKNGEGLWVRVSLKLEELRAVLPEVDIRLVT
ncbi:MAG: hypothetical protein J0L75_06155 [Spirochaetes bacterium]|nr:hypothetical protein [Spirochaetota bacterium]